MKPARHNSERGSHPAIRSAFTLLEVLLVLLILAILSGLVLSLSRHASANAKRAQALGELGEIHHALAGYYAAHDCYPLSATETAAGRPEPEPRDITDLWLDTPEWAPEQTGASASTNRWNLRYYLPLDFPTNDPWGNPYLYLHTTNAPLSFSLFSTGPRKLGKRAEVDEKDRIYLQP